jgi:fibronectin-binding autotransporter adhesin
MKKAFAFLFFTLIIQTPEWGWAPPTPTGTIRKVVTENVQMSPSACIVFPDATSQCTAGGGGGGTSSLAVYNGTSNNPGVFVSSPTGGINFDSNTTSGVKQGTTYFFSLLPSSVTLQGQNVINLTSTLQTGATFYVSSGTVNSQLTTGSLVNGALVTLGNKSSAGHNIDEFLIKDVGSTSAVFGWDNASSLGYFWQNGGGVNLMTLPTSSSSSNFGDLLLTYGVKAATAQITSLGTNTNICTDGSSNLTTSGCNNGTLTGNQTITLSGDSTGSGSTAITVTAAATQNNITKIPSSLTLGASGNAVTISSNAILSGATFYQGGPDVIGNTVRITGLGTSTNICTDGSSNLTTSGCNNGTITGVTAGTDLTGGGSSGNVTLNLDTTKVILNQSSLQSGTTAYPAFVYVGSSITVYGTSSIQQNTKANSLLISTGASSGAAMEVQISSNGETSFQSIILSTKAVVFESSSGVASVWYDNNPPASTDFLLGVSSANATLLVGIENNSHLISSGTVPAVSTCGTTPSVVGSDVAGTITVGGGVVTACTLTFQTAWSAAPTCLVADNSATVTAGITAISASAFTVSTSATLGGGLIFYHCIGNKQ